MIRYVNRSISTLLLLIMISQMLLMSFSGFQIKRSPVLHENVASVNAPCPKKINMQSVANKMCERASQTFLNVDYAFVLFLIADKLFFTDASRIIYSSPIYSIDKPPKN